MGREWAGERTEAMITRPDVAGPDLTAQFTNTPTVTISHS